ncbi:hypothetical protein [Pseudomonas sp. SIMBA_067]|uniref:hypothetical protein n=1 Tax=Pseudomonas sp. SIMBA_067 TaxID=3085807 RepID=UPI003977F3B0
MKRLDQNTKEINFAIGQSRWRRRLGRKGKKYNPDKVQPVRPLLHKDVIQAPKYISIYEFEGRMSPYLQTMAFIEAIRDRYKARDCIIDFSQTEKISAAALVVVYAAVEMAGAGRTGKAEVSFSQKSPAVNVAIRSSNLHKLIHGLEIKYSLDSARHMPIVSSVGREQMDEIVDFIQGRIYDDQMSPDKEHVYGDAVSETINNVRLHAYPNSPAEQKRWWLMCNTFGKKLYLAIYDCGVGIPKTVVEKPWFFQLVKHKDPKLFDELLKDLPDLDGLGIQILKPIVVRVPDERLIYYSMQNDVTGTNQEKHGQGSKSIKALVNDTQGGVLWVFSNNGLYTFRQKNQQPAEAKLRKRFPGTLVQWNIEI